MIRLGKMEDIQQVNVIRKEVNDLHVKGKPNIFKPGFCSALAEYVKQFVGSDDKMLLVCEENNLICAYAMIEFITKPETPYRYELEYLHIEELGTLQGQQGKGYGKAIMEKVKELAKERNISRLELDVWSFNEQAIKFYDKIGFERYREYLELNI